MDLMNTVVQLTELLKSSGLSALEVEEGDVRIRLENTRPAPDAAAPAGAIAAPAAPASDAENGAYLYVKSPMVGIFHTLEALGRPALKPGDPVSPDTVVCAVEAMKMMCDVESEVAGEFVELMVKDGDAVEYGQLLARLKKQ